MTPRGQQQQAGALGLRRGVVGGDPHIAADDGLDPGCTRPGVETHSGEQIVQVGDGQGALAIGARRGDGGVDPQAAIDNGVLGMDAEVDVGHACIVGRRPRRKHAQYGRENRVRHRAAPP
ncbi:hypothetical protein GALL_410380 [mine drainage metagenome]|uniref:Uncharacterized protein n=1 Tax=mine drainage metagenome TaxID=410659 RepID=A0A1J5Q1V8_9ZZZZ